MRVFLVDFENVKSDGLRCVDLLDSGDQVITFFSKNAESMSMDTYFNLIHSKASFYAVRLDRTGSNALDFQLVSYLGYLMGTAVDQDVFVISKDHGFHSAVSFCRNFLIPQSKYRKTVSQYPSIASLYPNHAEGRAAGINDIPLFLQENALKPQIKVDPQAEITVTETVETEVESMPIQPEATAPIKEEPSAEIKEATQVQPKRRDRGNNRDRYQNRNENQTERAEKPVTRSDWDEISAAAEVGLQIIDMFGGNTDKSAVKEEKPVEEKPQEIELPKNEEPMIEIKDFLSPTQVPEKIAEVQQEPERAAEEMPIEEQPSVLSGSEIDKMLEEFLQEAAAAIEAELKEMPQEDLAQFIEVETEQEEAVQEAVEEQQTPVAIPESKEEAPEVEKPVKERSNKQRSRKAKEPKVEVPTAEPVTEAIEEPAASEPVADVKKEQPKKQKKDRAPKQKAAEEKKEQAAIDPREIVKKSLTATIEIKDDETVEDMEKLIDCILEATGKQDLYRMIIKLFGQKTGLEYYKVVKREYTNICNQIGKK